MHQPHARAAVLHSKDLYSQSSIACRAHQTACWGRSNGHLTSTCLRPGGGRSVHVNQRGDTEVGNCDTLCHLKVLTQSIEAPLQILLPILLAQLLETPRGRVDNGVPVARHPLDLPCGESKWKDKKVSLNHRVHRVRPGDSQKPRPHTFFRRRRQERKLHHGGQLQARCAAHAA